MIEEILYINIWDDDEFEILKENDEDAVWMRDADGHLEQYEV